MLTIFGVKTFKIYFLNLNCTLRPSDNIILSALNKLYPNRIIEDPKSPEFLFFGEDHSIPHKQYNCVKIYVAQENKMPNFREYDYAMTYLELKDPRNIRLPFYVHGVRPSALVKGQKELDDLLAKKTKFCCFIASNLNLKRTQERVNFFNKLSRYKKVDSGGKVLNNIGYQVGNKKDFLLPYKFNIAFENRCYPGYTSEKIVHAMATRTLPIYWGNPSIQADFNPRSFINVHDYANFDEAIEKIIEIDKDDNLFLKMHQEPYFYGNKPSHFYSEERLMSFLQTIFESPSPKKRSFFYFKDILFNLRKNVERFAVKKG